MELGKIDEYEYKRLLGIKLNTIQDMYRLASYPYVSLLFQYKNLSFYEQRKIREIEDDNISTFLRIISLLFGIGSKEEVDTINNNMNCEPLRSAVIAAKQESNPLERVSKCIELACKLLLSVGKDGTNRFHAINVKINGKIPAFPFSDRQNIADMWFRNFVDIKLDGMKKVYRDLGADVAYKFVVSSTLYSLYHFAPSRYNISACCSDDEALHKVFEIFINLKRKNI